MKLFEILKEKPSKETQSSTNHQLKTFSMQIHDLDRGVFAEVFAELGNVDVHAACIEIGIVTPDGF